MAFICGFFDSVNGDRLYSAEMMNNPYNRLVSDGVFARPSGEQSTDFQVQSLGGMDIVVKKGDGIFFGKWSKLDADLNMTVPSADVTLSRTDSVIVRIDKSPNVRGGSIYIKQGTPASTPTPPALERNTNVYEYRLANINLSPNAIAITQANISDRRAIIEECGFVTHLLQQADITATYSEWQRQFEEWMHTIQENLSTYTIIVSLNSYHVTSVDGQTVVPVDIPRFIPGIDILQVYINGLMLVPELDYTMNALGTAITLTKAVAKDTPVSFIVYKSVDGSEAESVVDEVNDLLALQPTAITGAPQRQLTTADDVLSQFVLMGAGMHTLYAPSGAVNNPTPSGGFRFLGHMTGENNGWIMAFKADGSYYVNYLNSGNWEGWITLYEKNPSVLWQGGQFMQVSANIQPSKKLSECRSGWVLAFSDYDDATSTKNQYEVVTCVVPKLNVNGNPWNGSSYLCCLPTMTNNDGEYTMTVKKLYIYDDHITGFTGNSVGGTNRDVVLSAVYEY